jgi:(p)ppGpp synthase/HD superfamily hydrolase
VEELAVASSEPDELERLLARIQAYNPQADAQLIRRAYEYSARMHAEQKRKSGEPYVTHPLTSHSSSPSSS